MRSKNTPHLNLYKPYPSYRKNKKHQQKHKHKHRSWNVAPPLLDSTIETPFNSNTKRLHPRFTSWYATCNPAARRQFVVELWSFSASPRKVFPKLIVSLEVVHLLGCFSRDFLLGLSKTGNPPRWILAVVFLCGDTSKVINSKLVGSNITPTIPMTWGMGCLKPSILQIFGRERILDS